MASALLPWRPEVVYLASDSRLIVRGGRHTGVRFWAAGNGGRKGGEKSGRAGEIERGERSAREKRTYQRAGEQGKNRKPHLARADAFSRAAGRSRCRRAARTSLPRGRGRCSGPLPVCRAARLLWSANDLVRRCSGPPPPLVRRAEQVLIDSDCVFFYLLVGLFFRAGPDSSILYICFARCFAHFYFVSGI